MVWKMPSTDVSRLVFQIHEDLKAGYMVGYVVAILAVAGWFVHAKQLRKQFAVEIRRVGTERTKAQEARLGTKLRSSDLEQ